MIQKYPSAKKMSPYLPSYTKVVQINEKAAVKLSTCYRFVNNSSYAINVIQVTGMVQPNSRSRQTDLKSFPPKIQRKVIFLFKVTLSTSNDSCLQSLLM